MTLYDKRVEETEYDNENDKLLSDGVYHYEEDDLRKEIKKLKDLIKNRPSMYAFQESYFRTGLDEIFGEGLTK